MMVLGLLGPVAIFRQCFHIPALRSSEPRSRVTALTGAVKHLCGSWLPQSDRLTMLAFHPSWLCAERNPTTFFFNLT